MDKFDGTALGVGVSFFIVFWLATDNFALGISMGIALGAAIAVTRSEAKQQDGKDNSPDAGTRD